MSTHLPWKEPRLLLCLESKLKSIDSAQPDWRSWKVQAWKFTSCDRVWSMFFASVISKSPKKRGQGLSQTLEFKLSGKTLKDLWKKKSHSHRITGDGRESSESIAAASYLPLRGTYKEARTVDVLCELWEPTQFSPWDKQEASLRFLLLFFFFFSYLLCSGNTSTHDKEGFNQQWSSPTVSLDSKTEPVSSDVLHCGI